MSAQAQEQMAVKIGEKQLELLALQMAQGGFDPEKHQLVIKMEGNAMRCSYVLK